jgi:hypothetical protein
VATHWLTGPEGTYARVEDAARREVFTGLGWVEANEPARDGRVWLRHCATRAYAHFCAESLEGWHALGWEFAVPPIRNTEQGLEALVPAPLDYLEPQPEPTQAPVPADKPEAETVKEKTSA